MSQKDVKQEKGVTEEFEAVKSTQQNKPGQSEMTEFFSPFLSKLATGAAPLSIHLLSVQTSSLVVL